MATITKPMALDESFNTTESTSRNQADVLVGIEQAIVRGFGQVADAVAYDNTDSGLTADNVQDAIDEVDDTVDGLVDDVAEISSDIESTQTASGNPITLTDAAQINAESLVVELEPKQDLHGQSAPYVGGAGKNKLPMTVEWIKAANTSGSWSGNVYTIGSVTFEILVDSDNNVIGIKVNAPSTHDTQSLKISSFTRVSGTTYILNGCPTNGSANSYKLRWNGVGYDYGSGITTDGTSGTGDVAIDITTNVAVTNLVFFPMIRLSTETDPTFAPYSNICPITGYTECKVDDVRKNLFDKSSVTTGKYMNLDGTLSDWGTVCYSDYIRVKPNTSYYFSHVIGSSYGLSAICFDGFKNPLNQSIGVTGEGDGNGVVTTPNDCAYIVINAMASNKDIVQITDGSTAPTTYEPYHSSNATIQFGQTVYGGRSNFTEGGTSETMGETVLDGTTAPSNSFERTNTVAGFVPIGNQKKYATTHQTKVMCDSMPVFSPDYVYVNDVFGVSENISASANGIWVSVYKDMLTSYDITGLQAWLVANNLQIAYELETNVNISTPPTDLKLLQGTNNITTNGTTINLGYQPDNVIGDVKGEIEKCAVDAEFMQFTDGTDTFTDVNLSLNASLHTVSVVGSKIEQKRFICFEVMDKMGGVLQGIIASCIAFADGAKTPSGTAFRAYIESLQMYVDFRIYGSGGSYTLAYQSETSFSASAFYLRVRMMNNL